MALILLGLLAMIIAVRTIDFSGRPVGEQTFFEQFIISGGPIVWFVLLPMSVIMVFLAFEHCFTIRRKRLLPVEIAKRIAETAAQNGLRQLPGRLAGGADFVSIAVSEAVKNSGGDWGRLENRLGESFHEQALRLLRKIEWINIIGNVSPMVGLFGTVFGMIKLFNAIVIAGGQPQPSQLAAGISVALVTTFWGLFIAIPALAIHGVLRNRIETLTSEAALEAEKLLLLISKDLKKKIQTGEQIRTKLPIKEINGKPNQIITESASL